MAAVYCAKLKGLVDKNSPCRWRRGAKARGNLPACGKQAGPRR
jgi:hypothetical protein